MALNVTVTFSDGRTEALEITNPDRIRWDMTAQRQHWPEFTKAPFLGMTFLAWAACKRTGIYTDTWEQFSEHDCVDVSSETEDTEEDESPTATPTTPTSTEP